MATQQTQVLGRALLTPGVALLFIWMIVPLAMTIYFSTLHYNLLDPETEGFVGLENYRYFLTDPAFLTSLRNTLVLVGSVLAITILLGTPLALLLIVAWQWLPFATLILLTALQSQDEEQREAAEMDGASPLSTFVYLTLPHLARPITVVILIETIFLLTVFAEILVTTGGGPGLQTTNIAFLIYSQALIHFDVGTASAGGLVAVVIANVLAFFLVRVVGRNLEA